MSGLARLSRRGLVASGLALGALPAWALDPGVAAGRYASDGLTLAPTHALALLQDNVEGALDHPSQLRVLLSDVEAPVEALYGLAFPPVRAMARRGALQGLLLEFDPGDPTRLLMTVLAKPNDPRAFLPTISLSNSGGLWRRLEVSATRVVGELHPRDDGLALGFSAPVFTDAVEADLTGPAVQASEPLKVLIARAEALGRGDLAAALALSTPDAAETLRALSPEVVKMAQAEVPNMLRELKAARRVVIRRATAAVDVGGGWANLRRSAGTWKVAD